jgi:hypothetical protein
MYIYLLKEGDLHIVCTYSFVQVEESALFALSHSLIELIVCDIIIAVQFATSDFEEIIRSVSVPLEEEERVMST